MAILTRIQALFATSWICNAKVDLLPCIQVARCVAQAQAHATAGLSPSPRGKA
jgi:hypothetical protein